MPRPAIDCSSVAVFTRPAISRTRSASCARSCVPRACSRDAFAWSSSARDVRRRRDARHDADSRRSRSEGHARPVAGGSRRTCSGLRCTRQCLPLVTAVRDVRVSSDSRGGGGVGDCRRVESERGDCRSRGDSAGPVRSAADRHHSSTYIGSTPSASSIQGSANGCRRSSGPMGCLISWNDAFPDMDCVSYGDGMGRFRDRGTNERAGRVGCHHFRRDVVADRERDRAASFFDSPRQGSRNGWTVRSCKNLPPEPRRFAGYDANSRGGGREGDAGLESISKYESARLFTRSDWALAPMLQSGRSSVAGERG
jgi:hypothetical protein